MSLDERGSKSSCRKITLSRCKAEKEYRGRSAGGRKKTGRGENSRGFFIFSGELRRTYVKYYENTKHRVPRWGSPAPAAKHRKERHWRGRLGAERSRPHTCVVLGKFTPWKFSISRDINRTELLKRRSGITSGEPFVPKVCRDNRKVVAKCRSPGNGEPERRDIWG